MRLFALAFLRVLIMPLHAQALIPVPAHLEPRPGAGFNLGAGTRILAPGPARPLGERLALHLRPGTGLPLPVVEAGPERGAIRLALEPEAAEDGDEGYRLDVGPEGAWLRARRPAGLFHGIQTLRQLLPPEAFRSEPTPGVAWALPALTLADRPRFPWRGSHLDVARHFLPVPFLKRHLELMALHKLNVFHWHLTDDQGWRLEIRRHPRLAQVGSCAPGPGRSGFYTQEEVREVVRFAAERFIAVVPEIDLPGHCTAAIAAYPELGNVPGRALPVPGTWGVFPSILNPEDATLALFRDVLDEVLELFPGPWVHLGGDECPKDEWAASPAALARLLRCGLVPPGTTQDDLLHHRDASGRLAPHPALAALQTWFMTRMAEHLAAHGRVMVGWDEILEGGAPPGSLVMSWRGQEPGAAAARAGHRVIMAPEAFTYFSRDETTGPEPPEPGGLITLADVYRFEPVPADLPPAAARRVLGAQGQLWTECVATPELAEYRLWPRLAALAEVLWSPAGARDFAGFRERLERHLERFPALGAKFHPQR
jgi:hexosaminidase